MIMALYIVGYIAVALICVYMEARLTGDAFLTPTWMVWPAMLPIVGIAYLFHAVAEMGEDHGR